MHPFPAGFLEVCGSDALHLFRSGTFSLGALSSGCQEQKLQQLAQSLLPSFTPEQAPGEPSEGKGELSVKSLESQLRKEGRKEL